MSDDHPPVSASAWQRRWWLCAAFTLTGAACAVGFGLAGLLARVVNAWQPWSAESGFCALAGVLLASAAGPAWWLAHQHRIALGLVGTPEHAAAERQLSRIGGPLQATLAIPLMGLAMGLLWLAWPTAAGTTGELFCAIICFGLAFLALLGERTCHVATQWPDAPRLAAILRCLVLVLAVFGLGTLAHALGIALGVWLQRAVIGLLVAVCSELLLRALAQVFLPAPRPHLARTWLASAIADTLTAAGRSGGLRERFNLDLSRSFALRYLRRLVPALLVLAAVVWWGTTAVTALGLAERGVYERLGRPAAVLDPGLHVHLPWPFARVRRIDTGTVHEWSYAQSEPALQVTLLDADARPTAASDRLWDRRHPGEAFFIVPSAGAGERGQGFQVINSEVRVLWRLGSSDAQVIAAAYQIAEPEPLIRALTGQLLLETFAERTLATVIGSERSALVSALRTRLQAALDRQDSGIEITAVLLDAVHPPTGAAAAYHGVQAATIAAATDISVARSVANRSHHEAATATVATTTAAEARAAELLAQAASERHRFAADAAVAKTTGEALRFERWLQAVTSALSRARLTIVDHRFAPGALPLIDLRPLTLPAPPPTAKELP